MNIKGVAFDLEGTLVDLEKFHHDAHLEVARRVGLNLTLNEAIAKLPHFIGGPDNIIIEEIIALSGNSSLSVDELSKIDKKLYHEKLFYTSISPRNGVLAVLKQLVISNIPIAIGSLTDNEEALYILKKSGLDSIFLRNKVVLLSDVEKVKPAPDVFLKTAQLMGIDPKEQLVFEDSPNGIRAARSAGSIAIGMPVYNKSETIETLKKAGAWKIIKNWEEVNLKEIIETLRIEK